MYDQPPQWCNPKEPTLPDEFRTWNIGSPSEHGDFGKYRPWRRPGSAPNANPCGIASGFKPGGLTPPPPTPSGWPIGTNGTELPPLENVTTRWKAGSDVEVSWAILANHGGGYSYRLIPTKKNPTEQEFKSGHLDFVGNSSTIRWIDDRPPVFIPAKTVRSGTTPEGSQWRQDPIPACNCDLGFACYSKKGGFSKPYTNDPGVSDNCPTGIQFPEPAKGISGYTTMTSDKVHYTISDKVHIPKSFAPGNYMLSFRWDCEQTSQVWNQCADIVIH